MKSHLKMVLMLLYRNLENVNIKLEEDIMRTYAEPELVRCLQTLLLVLIEQRENVDCSVH